MTNNFEMTDEMQTYFESLPEMIQQSILHGNIKINNIDDLKSIADSKRNAEIKSQMQASINYYEKTNPQSFEDKYNLTPSITNKYAASVSNPTVQPDGKTEMGVPIPEKINTEFSKEYQEENKL